MIREKSGLLRRLVEGRRLALAPVALLAAGLAAVAVGWALLAALDRRFPFPEERLMAARACRTVLLRDADGEALAWRLDANGQWRIPVPLSRISPWLARAVVAAEDRRFYRHGGVDGLAVIRAAFGNVAGRTRSGASTLTMQTVRLLWPRPRVWRSKLIEAFRARQLERLRSKDEILEMYLNLAPFGGNVIGVEAASRRFLGKSAAALTPGEAALLAGLPQSPTRHHPVRRADSALRRRAYVLERLARDGALSAGQHDAARAQPPVVGTHRPDAGASRHAVDGLWNLASGSTLPDRRTTLNPRIQSALLRRAEALAGDGAVDGVALVVVEVATGAVRGWIGGRLPAGAPRGAIDAARIRRQPGSLLKPFLFAAALDAGLTAPDLRVVDDEFDWNGYRPRNADLSYRGALSAAEALRLSRNPPAVRWLHRLGGERFSGVLRAAGLRAAAPERAGLAAALGVEEQRLLDLANAYAALARLGVWRPLRFFEDDATAADEARQVVSAGAAWLTLAALADAPRPARAAKTGTSWNGRDAWAVAVSPAWVAAVWRGRLDGRGVPGLAGADDALPLVEILLENLDRDPAPWPRPETVVERTRCVRSGMTPGLYCAERLTGHALIGRDVSAPCLKCLPSGAGTDRVALAPHPSGARTGETVLIRMPRGDTEYLAEPGAEGAGLAFQARAGAGESVDWFVDGRAVGRTTGEGVLRLAVDPGAHEARAVVGGRAARVRFEVRPLF